MGVIVQRENCFVVALNRQLESAMSEPLLDPERSGLLGQGIRQKEEKEEVETASILPQFIPIILFSFQK
jgi:hypothetical protein